jgi:hypothetical protein
MNDRDSRVSPTTHSAAADVDVLQRSSRIQRSFALLSSCAVFEEDAAVGRAVLRADAALALRAGLPGRAFRAG